MNTPTPTRGKASILRISCPDGYLVKTPERNICLCAIEEQGRVDSVLIAECFTVYSQTGMRPKELLDQCEKLAADVAKKETEIAAHKEAITQVRSDRDKAIEAIEELMSNQNGPPLTAWEKDWNEAMAKCRAIRDQVKGQP